MMFLPVYCDECRNYAFLRLQCKCCGNEKLCVGKEGTMDFTHITKNSTDYELQEFLEARLRDPLYGKNLERLLQDLLRETSEHMRCTVCGTELVCPRCDS